MPRQVTGDCINEGIYDLHIRLKKFPYLPPKPPIGREPLKAKDVMATEVKSVCELEKVVAPFVFAWQAMRHSFDSRMGVLEIRGEKYATVAPPICRSVRSSSCSAPQPITGFPSLLTAAGAAILE